MISLQASIRSEFHAAVRSAVDAISQNNGWVETHQFYSNALAMISCQLPVLALPSIADSLDKAGFTVHHPLPQPSSRNGEVAVQLSLTILNDSPDIRRDVPAFG